MAYVVLARKYRPNCLADLVGQEPIVRTLHNAMALGRVHHAFLFTGARGVGKTTTARILARALNCSRGPTPTPCGECPPCREILAGKSADVLEIDGASNTGVDSVRELREHARYMPSLCATKVYIIDEVHMLSTSAFNALLKTLEEPPPHVKFIFATTEPHKIPVTILSRCQRFDFRRVGQAALVDHLRRILASEKLPLSDRLVEAVGREAQGSVRDALSLLDQVLSYRGSGAPASSDPDEDDARLLDALGILDRQVVFALWDGVAQRDAAALLHSVQDLDARGHDLSVVANLLAEHVRDLAVLAAVPEPAAALLPRSSGELAQLRAQAQARSPIDLQRLFREALALAEDVARSTMPRVSLEMGLLKLLLLAPTVDLETLVRRLDALAQGADPTPPQAAGPLDGRGGMAPQARLGGAQHAPPPPGDRGNRTVGAGPGVLASAPPPWAAPAGRAAGALAPDRAAPPGRERAGATPAVAQTPWQGRVHPGEAATGAPGSPGRAPGSHPGGGADPAPLPPATAVPGTTDGPEPASGSYSGAESASLPSAGAAPGSPGRAPGGHHGAGAVSPSLPPAAAAPRTTDGPGPVSGSHPGAGSASLPSAGAAPGSPGRAPGGHHGAGAVSPSLPPAAAAPRTTDGPGPASGSHPGAGSASLPPAAAAPRTTDGPGPASGSHPGAGSPSLPPAAAAPGTADGSGPATGSHQNVGAESAPMPLATAAPGTAHGPGSATGVHPGVGARSAQTVAAPTVTEGAGPATQGHPGAPHGPTAPLPGSATTRTSEGTGLSPAGSLPDAGVRSPSAARPTRQVPPTTPEQAPSPATPDDLDAAPSAAFTRFVTRVRGTRPALASVLEHGRVVAFDPTQVVLAYEPKTFYWDAAREADAQASLRQALTAQFSEEVPLRIVPVAAHPDAPPSLAQLQLRAQNSHENQMKQAALNDDAVRRTVAILGAEVTEVRPL